MSKQYLDFIGLSRYDAKIKEYILEHAGTSGITSIVLDNSSSSVVISGGTATIGMADYALKTDITAVLKFKGTKTSDQLAALTGMTAGDVYQIVSGGTGTTYKVGSEYAYDGSAWQELGPSIDLSGYVTTTDLSTALASYATTTALGNVDTKYGNSLRLKGSFTSVEAYTAKVAEYTAMDASTKAEHIGEAWKIPGGNITGFSADTYVAFMDASHPEMQKVAGFERNGLSWDKNNDTGTTLPTVSLYAGTIYDGRLFKKTDEDVFYMYRSNNAQAGQEGGAWEAFSEITGSISNNSIDSLFESVSPTGPTGE